jgi:dCTP deaminase
VGGKSVSTLSTAALKSRLRDPSLRNRLVISPLLDPAAQAKEGQAAVDVRLGFEFCLVVASSFGSVSEFSDSGGGVRQFEKLYKRIFVPFGASIVIHAHQFMLAQTLEYIRLPPDLMSYVVGRSTWGRLGLIVATAVGIHPNFSGSLTLELRNLGETPLTLFPGETIAQLFFHKVIGEDGAASTESASEAQYAGTVDMIPRRLSDPHTHTTLRKLIERYRSRSDGGVTSSK